MCSRWPDAFPTLDLSSIRRFTVRVFYVESIDVVDQQTQATVIPAREDESEAGEF